MAHAAAAATVAIVQSESSPAYQEFTDAVRTELRRDAVPPDVIVLDSDQAATRPLADVQFVIAAGIRAAQVLTARDLKQPLLLTLLPRSAYDHLVAGKHDDKRISAVFIDQSPARYIDLLHLALPNVDRIGILVGRDSRDTANALAQAARERKLKPVLETVASDSDIFPALQRMFADGNGVLLATPDTSVFNSQTIPNIVLSTYRYHVPIVGFTQAYVKTGALVAIYSTPSQIGLQAAEIVHGVLSGGALPGPQYPRQFDVGVNTYVARSLELQLDNETNLHDRLEKLEHGQ
ncbi:MAG TPA: ABC transporter substrate binding protein [Rhodocyclaceae bacterium]|nr:ABC transporter substrate binding protein [Rhodocyclaceae bacterium]